MVSQIEKKKSLPKILLAIAIIVSTMFWVTFLYSDMKLVEGSQSYMIEEYPEIETINLKYNPDNVGVNVIISDQYPENIVYAEYRHIYSEFIENSRSEVKIAYDIEIEGSSFILNIDSEEEMNQNVAFFGISFWRYSIYINSNYNVSFEADINSGAIDFFAKEIG